MDLRWQQMAESLKVPADSSYSPTVVGKVSDQCWHVWSWSIFPLQGACCRNYYPHYYCGSSSRVSSGTCHTYLVLFSDCLGIPQKYLKYLRELSEVHTTSGCFVLHFVYTVLVSRCLVCLDFKILLQYLCVPWMFCLFKIIGNLLILILTENSQHYLKCNAPSEFVLHGAVPRSSSRQAVTAVSPADTGSMLPRHSSCWGLSHYVILLLWFQRWLDL